VGDSGAANARVKNRPNKVFGKNRPYNAGNNAGKIAIISVILRFAKDAL
jgi:hypothetical protein